MCVYNFIFVVWVFDNDANNGNERCSSGVNGDHVIFVASLSHGVLMVRRKSRLQHFVAASEVCVTLKSKVFNESVYVSTWTDLY